jgi:primosomal protein N' (replication factor Y)
LATQLGSAEVITLYDPVPLRIVRVDNMCRAQLLVESTHRPSMQQLLRHWIAELNQDPGARRLNWQLEVDPLEI